MSRAAATAGRATDTATRLVRRHPRRRQLTRTRRFRRQGPHVEFHATPRRIARNRNAPPPGVSGAGDKPLHPRHELSAEHLRARPQLLPATWAGAPPAPRCSCESRSAAPARQRCLARWRVVGHRRRPQVARRFARYRRARPHLACVAERRRAWAASVATARRIPSTPGV